MTETPLDRAHAAMSAAPDDDRLRLRFHERLADAELFLLLEEEADGDRVAPRLFPVEGRTFVLAFDTEARMAEFAGGVAPYAALSGRALAGLLSEQDFGLALNPGVAPSSWLMDPAAVRWLAETLSRRPDEDAGVPTELLPPGRLPEALLEALDAKLPSAQGLARSAYLAGVRYDGGRTGHLMAFVDALDGAEPALAGAVNEALTFSGLDAGEIDVTFVPSASPFAAKLARVGLRFDLPVAETPAAPAPPGSDPDRPPNLR